MPPKRAPTATGMAAGLTWPQFRSAFSRQERAKGAAPTQTAISRAWRAYTGKKTSPSRKVSTSRKSATSPKEAASPKGSIYDQLVPQSGPSNTLEGEILRAANKIAYRWNNDGDHADAEPVGMPYAFLESVVFDAGPMDDDVSSDKKYSKYVDGLVKRAEELARSRKGRYTPFKGDMYKPETWKGIKTPE
jgi:hypothetical protein